MRCQGLKTAMQIISSCLITSDVLLGKARNTELSLADAHHSHLLIDKLCSYLSPDQVGAGDCRV